MARSDWALPRLLQEVVSRRETATSVALFRILLAASVLCSLGLIQRGNVLPAIWFSVEEGGVSALSSGHWLFHVLGGFTPKTVHWLYQAGVASAGLALLGFGGRVSVLLCQQCYVALCHLNDNASGGYDSLIILGLLLLMFTRPTATLSLDARLKRGAWTSAERISAWPRALLVFQILFMYSMTGLQKIGLAWTPLGGYTALHYVLNDPTWVRFDLGSAAWALEIPLRVGTALTWHWEQLSILLLFHWYYRVGKPSGSVGWFGRVFQRWDLRGSWAVMGLLMHAGIGLLLDVGPFSLVSLTYYVCLWGPGTWERLGQRLFAPGRRSSPR
jgi:hypothetical protein